MRSRVLMCVCWALSIGTAAGEQVIHRCIGDAGEVVFSQTACGPSSVSITLRPAQSLGGALRTSERAWLAERKQRAATAVSASPSRQSRSTRSAQRDEYRCKRARQQLDSVRAERRRGYKAGKGIKLREREERYETYLASFCS